MGMGVKELFPPDGLDSGQGQGDMWYMKRATMASAHLPQPHLREGISQRGRKHSAVQTPGNCKLQNCGNWKPGFLPWIFSSTTQEKSSPPASCS